MTNVHGKTVQWVVLYIGYEALYPQKAIAVLIPW